ncbi:hypothetical protein [Mesorhizobium sp. M00.F.Ca.ET.216.01.1.1]|uniref:hypothetical protein n=1 Tax=Mesorhizobium sp. M00.F.Ca.ET.216.01.1.1 TaxID=2500528 RepID=UPI000FDBF7D9|nr:hypothetical protein [Mesorhizobium sp. M00.F.Ca.ET.216.01.1.1]TGQ36515.1 hypothetical protein EN859_021900 [Mesorhizobium sp. M00.F.Ca.ET.216.01.1.1]
MDQISPLVTTPDDEDDERDRPFNAYRFAASDNAKGIVAEAIKLLLDYEKRSGLAKNKRRAVDQETFDLTVDAILSDLMRHHLVEYPADIYVTRSNRVLGTKSRYRPRAYSKVFPRVLDLLAKPELGYVSQDKAAPILGGSKSTVIRPGPTLLARMDDGDISTEDLDEHAYGETIILKRLKDADNYWDEGGLEQYDDTPTTGRYRHELDTINQWLAAADLQYDRRGIPWPHTSFDIGDRRLRRIFTQARFTSGGRMFGGFWQQLRKHERRQGLRIGGEKAVELDYGQVGPRILYGMAGHLPATNDLYFMHGYNQQRHGIKKVMSAMIFAGERLDRFPKDTRKLFRRGDRIGAVVEAIEANHPLIKDHFHKGLGHDAQFVESSILVDVLLELRAKGVVALPIHDAVMVPASKVSMTKEVMLRVFDAHAHVQGTVTVEG